MSHARKFLKECHFYATKYTKLGTTKTYIDRIYCHFFHRLDLLDEKICICLEVIAYWVQTIDLFCLKFFIFKIKIYVR